MRVYLSIGLLLIFSVCHSQSRIDSLAGNFLVETNSLDTLILKKMRKNSNVVIESNYYTKKELSIPLAGNEKIDVFSLEVIPSTMTNSC